MVRGPGLRVQPRGNACIALARATGSCSAVNHDAIAENRASHVHGGSGQLSRSRVRRSISGCQGSIEGSYHSIHVIVGP